MATDRGTYRSTYTALLDDEDFRRLPSESRHVLQTIKISRINNVAGIFVCSDGEIVTLSKQTGYTTKAIQKAIDTLCREGWVFYDGVVLWVRNQLRFEPNVKLTNEKQRVGIEKILKSLPKSTITAKFCKYYDLAYPFDSLSKGYRKAIDTLPRQEQEQEQEQEQDTSGAEGYPDESETPDPNRQMVDLYHSLCPSLPRVIKLTDHRKSLIRARLKEYPDSEFWEAFMRRVEASDFLTDRCSGKRNDWRADLEWCLKQENFVKILEGKYDNRNEQKAGQINDAGGVIGDPTKYATIGK